MIPRFFARTAACLSNYIHQWCDPCVIRLKKTDAQQTQNICITFIQRLRRWSNILQMIYKCFMFTAWVILWEIAWHVSQTGWCQIYNPQCQSDVSSDNGENLIELDGNISSNLSPHITYYCANWSWLALNPLCWSTVYADRPTLNQHWFNVTCLLGICISLTSCWIIMLYLSNKVIYTYT